MLMHMFQSGGWSMYLILLLLMVGWPPGFAGIVTSHFLSARHNLWLAGSIAVLLVLTLTMGAYGTYDGVQHMNSALAKADDPMTRATIAEFGMQESWVPLKFAAIGCIVHVLGFSVAFTLGLKRKRSHTSLSTEASPA